MLLRRYSTIQFSGAWAIVTNFRRWVPVSGFVLCSVEWESCYYPCRYRSKSLNTTVCPENHRICLLNYSKIDSSIYLRLIMLHSTTHFFRYHYEEIAWKFVVSNDPTIMIITSLHPCRQLTQTFPPNLNRQTSTVPESVESKRQRTK